MEQRVVAAASVVVVEAAAAVAAGPSSSSEKLRSGQAQRLEPMPAAKIRFRIGNKVDEILTKIDL